MFIFTHYPSTSLSVLLPYTYSSSLTNICVSCSISACAQTEIQAFNVRIRMKNRIIPLRVGENRGQVMPSWRALTRGDIWRQDRETCGGFSSKKLRPISLSTTRKLVGASIKIVIYLRQYINTFILLYFKCIDCIFALQIMHDTKCIYTNYIRERLIQNRHGI